MSLPLDELVRTDGNREAIERIVDITNEHDKPVKLFLVGPESSGKTEIMRARQLDRDLLSPKRVLYRPCKELPEALRANVYETYLEDLATYEVLFLDDFEGFWEDEELGPEMCKLLLMERNRRGGDTVIASRKPMAEHDLSGFGKLFDDFEEIRIERLNYDEMVDYVNMLVGIYTIEDQSPVLSPEAIDYIAHDLDVSMEMMRKAMHFLLTKYQGEPGEVLTRHFVEQALADQD